MKLFILALSMVLYSSASACESEFAGEKLLHSEVLKSGLDRSQEPPVQMYVRNCYYDGAITLEACKHYARAMGYGFSSAQIYPMPESKSTQLPVPGVVIDGSKSKAKKDKSVRVIPIHGWACRLDSGYKLINGRKIAEHYLILRSDPPFTSEE